MDISRGAGSEVYSCQRGDSPLILSLPHSGTRIPEDFAARMTSQAAKLPDTDWRVDELYDFAAGMGATVLKANYSRYVVDLNRPPDNADSLYPGQAVTGFCPLESFDGGAIYRKGRNPSAAETSRRRRLYWQPYHDRLQAELKRVAARHGFAILYDCHSIASRVPRFFAGRLPDLNLGTNRGMSCGAKLQTEVERALAASSFGYAVNGRFVGGYITRHYGRPQANRHALQMEIGQDAYMDGNGPSAYNLGKAAALKHCLQRILELLLKHASHHAQDREGARA